MRFDVCTSNPPYQRGANSKFFGKFIEKNAEVIADDGWFAMVAPTKGALIGSRYARPHLDRLGWFSVELGAQSWFPEVGTTVAIFTGDLTRPLGPLTVLVGEESIEQSREAPLPMHSDASALSVSVVRKFFEHPNKIDFLPVKGNEGHEQFAFVPRQVIRYTPHKPRGGDKCADCGVNDWAGREHRDGRVVLTDRAEELKQVLRSDLYRFVWAQVLTSNYIPPFVWQQLAWIDGGLGEQARAIGLTAEETEFVERWAT